MACLSFSFANLTKINQSWNELSSEFVFQKSGVPGHNQKFSCRLMDTFRRL